MSSKIHVTGDVQFIKIGSRNRQNKEGKAQYRVVIKMSGGNSLYLYVTIYDINKLKIALNSFWSEFRDGR